MKIALIGTGYIAGRHAAALSAMADIEIIGHVDVVPGAAEKAAATYGGRAYMSVDELLAVEQVDAVWVCVPPFAHGDIERSCIAAGLPMYIEKPLGVDMDLPSQLAADIASASSHSGTGGKGLVVNVGYYWRCIEVMPKLRAMLAETPPRLVRIAYHGPTAPAAWWRQQAKSGGQVIEQATHLVDTARYLLGEADVLHAVASRNDRPAFPDLDIATVTAALLRFGSGQEAVNASFTASCVLGSFVDTAIEFLCDGRKITLSLKELTVDDADGKHTEPTGEDPLVLADRAFIAAVKADDPAAVPCSYDEALRTQQLCYDITVASLKETVHE